MFEPVFVLSSYLKDLELNPEALRLVLSLIPLLVYSSFSTQRFSITKATPKSFSLDWKQNHRITDFDFSYKSATQNKLSCQIFNNHDAYQ